jgi:hypothetical protein
VIQGFSDLIEKKLVLSSQRMLLAANNLVVPRGRTKLASHIS